MTRQKWLMLIAVGSLLVTTSALLQRLHTHQRLGRPGVKTLALAGSERLEVVLPERVLGCGSECLDPDKTSLEMLPQDTSFGQRLYHAPNGFEFAINVVLMGRDRTSLHPPQFCLRGTGWVIKETESATVPMTQPVKYNLPVTKLILAPEGGSTMEDRRRIYVYWFVAENELTASHYQRMWWMFRDQVTTGVLQRWAYITCLADCPPGQEQATFERLRTVIAAAAPEFQSTPAGITAIAAVNP